MKITVGVKIGEGKIECDDTALVGDSIINNAFYSVEVTPPILVCAADGVGGNAGGKEASLFITKELSAVNFYNKSKDEIVLSIKDINSRLIKYAKDNPGLLNMATTMTAIWIDEENSSYLIHVGNTRAYELRGTYLKQLTTDHTMYQWLKNHGQDEAAEGSNKNEIIACFGGGKEELIDSLMVEEVFTNGLPKSLIITSDGIHDNVSIDDIEECLKDSTDDETVIHTLMELAKNSGTKDDMTVMIIRK